MMVFSWVQSVTSHWFTIHLFSLSSGYLSVCLSGFWKERWCVVRGGSLYLQKEPGDHRPPVIVVPLKGGDVAVVPGGLGPKHPFSFRILQGGNELAALEVQFNSGSLFSVTRTFWQKQSSCSKTLEGSCASVCACVHQASCSEDLGHWLGVLFAETGSATLPEELHYDYIDVDTLTDIRHAARHSFLWVTSYSICCCVSACICPKFSMSYYSVYPEIHLSLPLCPISWATTTTASSSSASTDSRTYDEVYESIEVRTHHVSQ